MVKNRPQRLWNVKSGMIGDLALGGDTAQDETLEEARVCILVIQTRIMLEAEAAIVLRIAEQDAALGGHALQHGQTFADDGLTNSPSLVLGPDRDRAKAKPVATDAIDLHR